MADNPFDQFDTKKNPFDQFDAPVAAAPDEASVPASAPEGFSAYMKRNYGIPLARAGINAVTALPLMAQDLGVAVRNVAEDASDNGLGTAVGHLIHGPGDYRYPYELPSHVVQQAIQPYLPAPTTTSGKISEFANTAILGGAASGIPGMTAPTYGNVPKGFISPSVRPPRLTTGQQQAAEGGQALGMRLTPGAQTGSRTLQQIDARLQSVPATSAPFNSLIANNQRILNQSTATGIGENASEVSSGVMGQAYGRMGDVFDSARSPNNVLMTNPEETTTALNAIDSEAEGLLPGSGSVRDNVLVKRLESLSSSGSINTEQLGKLSSKLGNVAYKNMSQPGGDRDLADALYRVKDHADELLMRTMSPEEAATYAATKGQYRNLMNVSPPSVTNSASGNVSGLNLANRLASKDRSGFTFGGNQTPMYAAARFTKAFPSIVGDSGTATRSEGLTGLLMSIPGNIASYGYMKGAAPLYKAVTTLPSVFNQGLPPAGLSGLSSAISEYVQN